MGAMIEVETGERVPLRTRSFIGRAPDSELLLKHASVSRLHAVLAWVGGAWEIQDLGSNNGTFVDGRRVPRGTGVGLEAGTVLGFGTLPAVFRLDDAAGPQPLARAADGSWTEGVGGTLELPDPSEQGVVVWRGPSGAWVLEDEGGTRTVSDGEVVAVGGRNWRLFLPIHADLPDTLAQQQPNVPAAEAAALVFDAGRYAPEERSIVGSAGWVALSPMEAKLLLYLAERPGKATSHRELLSEVWGYRDGAESRTLYVTVNRLRRKIERDPTAPRHLLAVAGMGYRLVLGVGQVG